MTRQLKPWHILARELYVNAQGEISGLDIMRELNKRLPKNKIPTHPTTVQVFIKKNREEWAKLIMARELFYPKTELELINTKLDLIIKYLRHNGGAHETSV